MTISGKPVRLSREQVIRSLKDIPPERLQIHAVEVEGRRFPVKQAFALTTGEDLLDFTTTEARRALKKLGFEVFRIR